jgi:hypothetical protein
MRNLTLCLAAVLGLAGSVRADDNIVIVFDTSGSMGEYMRTAKATRMKATQDALVSVLSKVPDTTKVGVLTFNGWIYDLQAVDRAKLEAAIRGTSPGGGTPLYEHIKKGADRLLEERAKQLNVGSYKLIVATDGAADSDHLNQDGKFADGSFKPGCLKDIIGRGITVDAIGLDMRGDHPLKTQINGTYMTGDNPGNIQQSLQKSVAEVGFDGKDGAGQVSFDEIAALPDNFCKDAIRGLTEFRNYPIGDKPPVFVVKDGVLISVPQADTPGASDGMAWYWWVLIVIGGIVFVLVIIAVVNTNCGCR